MADEGDSGRPALRVVTGGAAATTGLGGGGRSSAADERDLKAFLTGERAAFNALVARHQPLVLSLVRRYARPPRTPATSPSAPSCAPSRRPAAATAGTFTRTSRSAAGWCAWP